MLILDAFRGHLSDELKVELERKNFNLVVVLGGMTSQLQPLDVSVNKPFKDYLRKEYEAWLLSKNLPLTPSGKIKRASASELAEWVSAAWKKIAGKTVEQSFKKCRITNALDGTKNYILRNMCDLDCPDLKSVLEKSVCSECETRCTSEEDSEQINLFNLNFKIFLFGNTKKFYS
jgi:hypothetical protein